MARIQASSCGSESSTGAQGVKLGIERGNRLPYRHCKAWPHSRISVHSPNGVDLCPQEVPASAIVGAGLMCSRLCAWVEQGGCNR